MTEPVDYLENCREVDPEDARDIDGCWVFVPNVMLRDALNQGQNGARLLDEYAIIVIPGIRARL